MIREQQVQRLVRAMRAESRATKDLPSGGAQAAKRWRQAMNLTLAVQRNSSDEEVYEALRRKHL